jgi:hypothetical protein
MRVPANRYARCALARGSETCGMTMTFEKLSPPSPGTVHRRAPPPPPKVLRDATQHQAPPAPPPRRPKSAHGASTRVAPPPPPHRRRAVSDPTVAAVPPPLPPHRHGHPLTPQTLVATAPTPNNAHDLLQQIRAVKLKPVVLSAQASEALQPGEDDMFDFVIRHLEQRRRKVRESDSDGESVNSFEW